MKKLLYWYLRTTHGSIYMYLVLLIACLVAGILIVDTAFHYLGIALILGAILVNFFVGKWGSDRLEVVSQLYLDELHKDIVEYRKLPGLEVAMNAFWLKTLPDFKQLKIDMENFK